MLGSTRSNPIFAFIRAVVGKDSNRETDACRGPGSSVSFFAALDRVINKPVLTR